MRLHRALHLVLSIPLLVIACGDSADDLADPLPEGDASATTCDSADDCSGATPVCDELVGACVQCLFDTQCESDEVCDDKVCVARTTCDSSLDCVDHAPRTICDPASDTCVECVEATDCTGTADCIVNQCEPYVDCDNSLDCPSGQVCVTALGRCAECQEKADCPDGDECIANECKTIVECASDNQCTPMGQLCDKALGYCVDCTNDDQCPGAYHCELGSCELDVCESGASSCQGNAIVACLPSGAGWASPQPCASRTTCKSTGGTASCQPWVCEPAQTACDGDVLESCSDDGLSVESSVDCSATNEHCFDGACADSACTPNASYCAGNEVRTCDGSGSSYTVTDTCTTSEYCDVGTATCQPLVCAPGASVCNGSIATTCNATGSGYTPGGTDCAAEGKACSEGTCITGTFDNCGWSTANSYYACGGQGADPSGTNPIACPPGLQVNGSCGTVTQIGCCDENGDNWYCNGFFLTMETCEDPQPPAPGVRCGASSCSTPSQFCCFASTTSAQCLGDGTSCSSGTPIHCDGPEDCSGQICCGESISGSSYTIVECRTSCSATDNIVFCNPQGANVCASGMTCQASNVLTGYYVCR